MTKTTKVLGALLLLLAGSAYAQIQTVIVTGSVDKPSGSSTDALDPCRRCEITVEYVGTNDLTSNSTVVTDTPSVFITDDSGDWTTSPLELLEGGNYRFRFRDPAWPQAGIFLDVTKTAADDDADGTVAFSVLTTVNVAEGADVSALDHGSLTGLSDDDHTQYAKKAGEAGYSGTHDFSGATVSGIAYGDLSGTPATFAPSSHTIASHSDTTATGAELETLTDGSAADSLHTHAGLDDWSDSGTVVSVQSGRDVAIGASVSVDNSTGTVDALAYTVGGTALASTDLSDGATVTNLGDTIEASEISDLAAGTDITADLEEESHGSEHGEAGGDPIPLGTFELSDLGDVSVAAPSSGQALAWGGSAWEPTTITGSVSAADDLSDVAVTTPSSGQVLVHDGVGDFKNVTVSGDATLAANGALSLASGSVDTAELAAGAVTDTEIAAAAGIALSKIADSATAGLFLQSGGTGGDPAYGAIVTGDLPSGATLDTEWDTIAELEAATGADIFTTADGALADDDLSDDSINALSDVDTVTSAPTSGQVLSWDGISAWTPGTDDDVPESGDFGAAADLEADGSLSADVVGAAELADRDWGDVTSAAGVITIDTGAVGTDEIATDGVGAAEIAANAVGASELADDAVDLAALSDADYGDWSVALGAATLDANTVGASELEATAVTPGSYTFTALTVDADGRITAASSGTDDDSPDSDAEVPDAITVGVGGNVLAAATVSVEAAEISDANAGTDLTADLEEETHASEHQNGGADEISVAGLSGQLADAQPIAVHKDGAAATGTRPALNFLDTSPITVALADDSLNGRVDVTIACPTCSTDSYALSVQEGDVELTGSATALDFGAGFDLTETPTGEANIVLDYTEDPVNLSGSEVTGTLPASSVGNGLTDAQVSDVLTIGSGGSVAAGALPSTVVYENGTHTMSGSFDFSTGTITVAADEWVDADVSNAITVDNYLPLAGGAMTGNVTASAGVTFDGVDLSALNFTDLAGTASDAQIPDTITINGSANVSNASLNAEVMRTDTTETVASIHTYTAAPNMNTTGVPFTMGVGVTGTVTRLDADLLDGEHASAFADASHAHAGEDITSGTVADARIASTLTRDTEWDTAAEINAATTDDDFVTETGTHTVSGTYTLTGSVDAGGGTIEVPNSTTLPATCAVGDLYMDTDATSGQRLYLCESANTWAVQGDGDGGSTTLDTAYDNEGGTGNRVVNMDDGNVKFDLDDATNDYHVVVDNTTTGTMDRGIQVGISGVGGVITDAIDASAAGIVNAIDIGANNIATDAATISSDELEVLDNGLDPADMDDNDWGDFTVASGVFTLDADVVSTDEIADGDHGDFTYSGGTATIDADAVTAAKLADADFGDFTGVADVYTLDDDVVAPAEMADADHGDVSWSGGVATVQDASGCVDCLDWDNLSDTMTVDADTTITLSGLNDVDLTWDVQGSSGTSASVTWDVAVGTASPATWTVQNGASIPLIRVDGFKTYLGTGEQLVHLQLDDASDDVRITQDSGQTALTLIAGAALSQPAIDATDADWDAAIDIGANNIDTDSGNVTAAELAILGSGVTLSELTDGDWGDATKSGGSLTLDAGVVTRDEIDETQLSAQTHATDCTALTCDAGSDGEMCFEQDDDAWYVCDGSGTPAWAAIGGGSTAFSDITTGTNTTATMTVGTGGSLTTSGSGTIAATTSAALAANGSNCSAGQAAGGVDAAGAAEDCTTYLQNVVEDTTPQLGGSLDAQGNSVTDLGDVTFRTGVSGGTLRTGTSAADKFILQAYDVDGAAYLDMLELDAGNTPLMSLLHVTEIDMDAGGQIRSGTGAGETLLLQARDVDGASWTTFATLTSNNTPTLDLNASTTVGGASIQTGTDDDVPESGDFGNAVDLESDGSLSADVVAAAEMADADHGDISWSGGVASIDSAVVGRTEIDETLLSIQTHATDCTALTCDAGSDGELCFEQDADQVYACDGSGTPAWAAIGGGSTGFDAITTGTNTTATMTVGTGASIVASGSGSITATGVAANSVALSTDTTGNYVATVADAGNSTVTVTGSGSEGAAVTLDVVDVNCTDCLGTTEIADSYVLNAGDTMTGDLTLDDGVTDSPAVTFTNSAGQSTSVYQSFGTGSLLWETNDAGNTQITLSNAGAGDAYLAANALLASAGGSFSGEVYADGWVGVGATTAASAACIANDGSDRIFHDADCDETKDAGEEYIDINTRQHEEWIAAGDARCYHQSSGGATADASDQASSSAHAWGAGYIFPDGSSTTITCRVRMPANFDASAAVEIQLDGHTEGAVAGAADVDFEVAIKEVGDGESWASAFGSAQGTTAGELDINVGNFATDVSERTSWFTLTETLAAGDWLVLEITRDGGDVTNDDKTSDFRLDDIGVRWTETLE